MRMFFGHPDDPANPQGGTDITNEELEDLEILEAENNYDALKSENNELNLKSND